MSESQLYAYIRTYVYEHTYDYILILEIRFTDNMNIIHFQMIINKIKFTKFYCIQYSIN